MTINAVSQWEPVASNAVGGDLLESNGDGCARPQSDDVIRSRTIGKVSSSQILETYGDGSFKRRSAPPRAWPRASAGRDT